MLPASNYRAAPAVCAIGRFVFGRFAQFGARLRRGGERDVMQHRHIGNRSAADVDHKS